MESSQQVTGGYPASLSQAVVLANGVVVTIRPIRAEDALLEVEFLQGLSSESRYQRFLYELDELTDAFNQMVGELKAERERREMFISSVAHDMKNLTSPLSLAVQLLREPSRTTPWAASTARRWPTAGAASAA